MATATPPRPSPSVVLEGVPWDDYEAQLRIIGKRRIDVNYDSGTMEILATRPRLRHGVVLEDVSWDDYETQVRIIGNRRIRVTYDSGRMEIMSPLWSHGKGANLVGRLVDVLTEELDVPTQGADPVTLKRIGLHKAVEPDRLFYFGANAARVQGNRELNLAVDPPPDLVIEVDVTASSVPRLPIFAALGIPEVWRIDEDARLVFLHLEPDGAYQPRDRSRAFPALLVAEAARFLEQGQAADMTAWIRTFRAYVRDVVVPRPE